MHSTEACANVVSVRGTRPPEWESLVGIWLRRDLRDKYHQSDLVTHFECDAIHARRVLPDTQAGVVRTDVDDAILPRVRLSVNYGSCHPQHGAFV